MSDQNNMVKPKSRPASCSATANVNNPMMTPINDKKDNQNHKAHGPIIMNVATKMTPPPKRTKVTIKSPNANREDRTDIAGVKIVLMSQHMACGRVFEKSLASLRIRVDLLLTGFVDETQ